MNVFDCISNYVEIEQSLAMCGYSIVPIVENNITFFYVCGTIDSSFNYKCYSLAELKAFEVGVIFGRRCDD